MVDLMTVTQRDGSVWAVPVKVIARDRAAHYAHEFGGDVERSLAEDTIPLFDADVYAIEDWAVGNMNWKDFDGRQAKVSSAPPLTDEDFCEAWLNGKKGFPGIADK